MACLLCLTRTHSWVPRGQFKKLQYNPAFDGPKSVRATDPANTKRYKNAIRTSTMFYGRSLDVLVMLCVSRGSSPVLMYRTYSYVPAFINYFSRQRRKMNDFQAF